MTQTDAELGAGCPVCGGSRRLEPLVGLMVPILCNVLFDSKDEAMKAPTGRMDLVSCGNCGHLYNAAFDANALGYDASYENSLHFSPSFRAYAEALADQLISDHAVCNKTVVDIGCGKGDFLGLLCKKGNNRGFGFDPSYEPGRDGAEDDRFTVIRDYYSEKYADVAADLVSCRHVLEHVADPVAFLASVRRSLNARPDARCYFEVPDGRYMLREMAVWDLIYEHYSYFTPTSLNWAFNQAGFDVLEVQSGFGGQFLQVLARPMVDNIEPPGPPPAPNPELNTLAKDFGRRLEAKVAGWRQFLRKHRHDGRRIAVWGAGSKGVSFASLTEPDAIDCLVDINPHKRGKYIPTTGHPVIVPDALRERQVDTVLLMNGNYAEEVAESLGVLGIEVDLLVEQEWYRTHDTARTA